MNIFKSVCFKIGKTLRLFLYWQKECPSFTVHAITDLSLHLVSEVVILIKLFRTLMVCHSTTIQRFLVNSPQLLTLKIISVTDVLISQISPILLLCLIVCSSNEKCLYSVCSFNEMKGQIQTKLRTRNCSFYFHSMKMSRDKFFLYSFIKKSGFRLIIM